MADENPNAPQQSILQQNVSSEEANAAEIYDQNLPKEMMMDTVTRMADIPIPTDGHASPQIGRSNNAFCTSSDDVLNVFNFQDDQEAFGYDQVNSRNPEDSPKVILVCGDLFRSVCKNVNALASILLEPQNKLLLKNFLKEFHGSQEIPWVVGASLKHWASKLTLEEDTEPGTGKLPYLKTTQALSGKGEVDDPKALDRLEEKVYEYLGKLDEEGPFNEAVQSIGFVVNYICDTIDPIEPEADLSGREFAAQQNARQVYEDLLQELNEAEAGIQELQARVQTPVPAPEREPSENKLLHRIAGFDSFMGIADQSAPPVDSETQIPDTASKSHHSIFPLVFPSKSGMLSAAFTTPSKLSTINSNHLLETKISLTLLASTSSRPRQVATDENRNLFTQDNQGSGAEVDVEGEVLNDSQTSSDEMKEGSRQTGEDIADEIVRQLWNEDPKTFALASGLEATVDTKNQSDSVDQPATPAVCPANGSQTVDKVKGVSEKGSGAGQKQSPAKDVGKGISKPVASGANGSKGSVKTSGTNNNKVNPKIQGKGSSSSCSNAASKKTGGSPAKSANRQAGCAIKTGRPVKPGIAFGMKVDPKPRSQLTGAAKPTTNVSGTTKKPVSKPTPRKVEPAKVASGCRRIEFTKVKQTISYRQLNKENLELLQAPVGHSSDNGVVTSTAGGNALPGNQSSSTNPGPTRTTNSSSVLPSSFPGTFRVKGNLPLPEAHTAPGSICNFTPELKVFENLKLLESAPSTGNSSQIPSLTRVKSASTVKSKTTTNYAELHRHKKCFQEAILKSQYTTTAAGSPKARQGSEGPGTKIPPRFQ